MFRLKTKQKNIEPNIIEWDYRKWPAIVKLHKTSLIKSCKGWLVGCCFLCKKSLGGRGGRSTVMYIISPDYTLLIQKSIVFTLSNTDFHNHLPPVPLLECQCLTPTLSLRATKQFGVRQVSLGAASVFPTYTHSFSLPRVDDLILSGLLTQTTVMMFSYHHRNIKELPVRCLSTHPSGFR